ncbi:MAG: SGNH/GDSL hydrolase family protein [Planctomycetia bacterium]|nr:SGNH/GDSL hydrolase family protein [Planctomycetia bacterium]
MSDNPQPATPIIVQPEPSTKPARRKIPRLVWLLALGLAAIGSTLFYVYFWYSRPVGEGPAGPAVSAEKFEYNWTDRPVLLVGIGDSVTHGYGSSPGKGFFARLVKNPPDEFADMREKSLSHVFPNLTDLNLSKPATNSLECLERQIPELKKQDEDTFGIIVMTTGGNDIIHDYGRTPPREGAMYGATFEQAQPWIANFKTRLDAIIDGIQAKFPAGCVFFIANIYDPTDDVGDATTAGFPAWPDALKIIRAYNEVIAHTAENRKNVELVDMHAGFLGHGIHCVQFWRKSYDKRDPHYWYWENLEDPNDRGYDALRRMFLNEMARVLPSLLEDGD